MTRGHRRVPSALDYAAVPEGARRLWRELDDLAREWESVHATLSQLATNLGCSTSAVQKWRRALVGAGWLEVEAATNRSEVSLWTPLRRARPVTRHGALPVDNRAGRVDGRVDGRPPSDLAKGGRSSTLDAPATRARTPEQKRGDDAAWCGRCDSPSYRWVETRTGYVRCPACHPATVPAF